MLKTRNIDKKPSSFRYYQEGPPSLDSLNDWQLDIFDEKVFLGRFLIDDLKSFSQVCESRRYVCVCNWSIRRYWGGAFLETILEKVGFNVSNCKNKYIKQISFGTTKDGKYDSTISLERAIRNNALLVTSVDGEDLSLEQGFPARLIDFSLYGYKGVKCINKIIITNNFDVGYWEGKMGYDKHGFIEEKKYWIVDQRFHKFISSRGKEVVEF